MSDEQPSYFPDDFPARAPSRRGLARGKHNAFKVAPPVPIVIHPRPGGSGGGSKPKVWADPCAGCPCASQVKVKPTLPPTQRLIAVGMAPGAQEEREGRGFVGPSGVMLRAALRRAGLDPETEVGYVNLARCRPLDDKFDSKPWTEAEKRCWRYLSADLTPIDPTIPLLLLGNRPLAKFLPTDARKPKIIGHRGLWVETAGGRKAFAALHPASILRLPGPERAERTQQFEHDIARMAERLLGQETASPIQVTVFPNPGTAESFLRMLAQQEEAPWSADIESYDAKGEHRKHVATDPCHPDFRVRGVAIAQDATHGAWIELMPWEQNKPAARTLLDRAFQSPAPKWFFNGPFDEEGLVYPGWVTAVRNRAGDGMLALVALGDATHDSLRLEKAVVDILDIPQAWDGLDKSRMQEYSIEQVARGAVFDACHTLQLCELLHARLDQGEYL